MSKASSILKDTSGNVVIKAVAIMFVLLVFSAATFEYIRLQIVAKGVRDAMQTAITTVCTQNYSNVYNGLREGYSGGYVLANNGNWTQNIDSGDVYSQLDKLLKTKDEGSCHVKYSGEAKEFTLSALSVQMTNTPIAPNDNQKETKFSGTAHVTLEVPLAFAWRNLPPMRLQMEIAAGYTSKY